MTEYISSIRKLVGHMPIMQCGASVILVNNRGELLLQKRRDNGCWGYHGGSVELDEIVEEAAKRELYEETGLKAEELELFGVFSGPELHYVYPNGDIVSNIDIVYLCHKYSGELKANKFEVNELRFFKLNELPDNISPPERKVLRKYLEVYASGTQSSISIVPYERKYHDDMLFCYLAAKDAISSYAPTEWSKPVLRDDLLNIENTYFERGDVFYLAIDSRDRVVGMIGTQTVSPVDLWLKRLFIKPELKGQGIGSKLLAAVYEFAISKGITTIYTRFAYWYQEAAVFYPAKGFIEISSDNHLRVMKKTL